VAREAGRFLIYEEGRDRGDTRTRSAGDGGFPCELPAKVINADYYG